ncbi:MAG: 7-cyano-7-deazaguanine synthase QueC [Bacteriovoracia bacterium]
MVDAIVLVSGGMDSLVCAAEAVKKHKSVAFLHMDYGQKTSSREYDSFVKIADHYQIPKHLRKIIDMRFLQQIGGSSLTDASISVKDYQGDSDLIPDSYVPFRNSIILSLAVSWAEVVGAGILYIGANWEDSPGYPDCRPQYYEAFNKLVGLGTKASHIKIETPVILLKKKAIVELGVKLKAPFELSWSCYARSDKACGVCDSCALRMRGFTEAGMKDPIPYV